jgi:hypothetical protein
MWNQDTVSPVDAGKSAQNQPYPLWAHPRTLRTLETVHSRRLSCLITSHSALLGGMKAAGEGKRKGGS